MQFEFNVDYLEYHKSARALFEANIIDIHPSPQMLGFSKRTRDRLNTRKPDWPKQNQLKPKTNTEISSTTLGALSQQRYIP